MENPCVKCGLEVDPQDSFCPNCGFQQDRLEKREDSRDKSGDLDRVTIATPLTRPRKFYRSREDRKIAGVCGGLGEYFNVDPSLIRIGSLVLLISGGIFVLFGSGMGFFLNFTLSLLYFSFTLAFEENPHQRPKVKGN